MAEIRTWIDLKNYLCHLVIQIHLIYGGDNEEETEKEFLREYCREIIQAYKIDLFVPITVFEGLIQQAKDCGWIRRDYSASERFTETDRRRAVMK